MSKQYLSVPKAFEVETGRRPHPSTCWRFANQGSKGVVLQTWMIGGRRCTTTEAVRAFVEACTETTTPSEGVSKVRRQLNSELGIGQ
jgi:hypothetical protein